MSYTVDEYKVAFKFNNRSTSSEKYFQSDREDLDILRLFKKAVSIDGYDINNIEDVHVFKYNRFSKNWEMQNKYEQLN